MPLAIELAAGWADTLSLAEIAAELERGDELLTSTASDVPARHRSVRTVCDTTWGRLSAEEQAIFAQVAVFRGGGTRRALQAVTGASLGNLHTLVGKALLRYDPERERYSVHELLRQYAAERLAEDAAAERGAQQRHAAYYLGVLAAREVELKGTGQRETLDAMSKDIENIHAAWRWAVEARAMDMLAPAVGALSLAYEWLGRSEDGLIAMQMAAHMVAALPSAPIELHAILLATQARFTLLRGDRAGAAALLQQAQMVLDAHGGGPATDAARAQVLLEAGRCAVGQNTVTTRDAFVQSHALFQALGDQWGMATALVGLGFIMHSLVASHSYTEAQGYLEQGAALYRGLGDRVGLSEALTILSINTRYQSRFSEAETLAREAYALAQTSGNLRAIAQAGTYLGAALSWNEKHAEAIDVLRPALAIIHDLGLRADLPVTSIRLGYATMNLGHYAEARTIFTAGLAAAQAVDSALATIEALIALSEVNLVEGAAAEACHLTEEAITVGQRDDSIFEAIVIRALAERRLGNTLRARGYCMAALRSNVPARNLLHWPLWAAALLLADDGMPERAAEAFALAERHWLQDDVWAQDVAVRELRAIVAALPPAVAAAAQARWVARDAWEAGAELLAELEAEGWGAE